MSEPGSMPRRQRVAAYAVIIRLHEGREQILLSRLAPYLAAEESWTLPGGGIEFGEHPRDAVVREVHEETGLAVTVDDRARIGSARRTTPDSGTDLHSVRIVYDGWVPVDSPEPHVVEVDGSTVDARWMELAAVRDGSVPVVAMVADAVAEGPVRQLQRLAAYALVTRGSGPDEAVLLIRLSSTSAFPGVWGLPGGGVDHGESPEAALVRELEEECGLDVRIGDLLGVHDLHFTGVAPEGDTQDFHGVHLVYAASVMGRDEPRVVEEAGTTDAVAWVPRAGLEAGSVELMDVVHFALQRQR